MAFAERWFAKHDLDHIGSGSADVPYNLPGSAASQLCGKKRKDELQRITASSTPAGPVDHVLVVLSRVSMTKLVILLV